MVFLCIAESLACFSRSRLTRNGKQSVLMIVVYPKSIDLIRTIVKSYDLSATPTFGVHNLIGLRYKNSNVVGDLEMKTYVCIVCGLVYDEAAGMPSEGIPAGTLWADVPADWLCPDCGVAKSDFEMVEV